MIRSLLISALLVASSAAFVVGCTNEPSAEQVQQQAQIAQAAAAASAAAATERLAADRIPYPLTKIGG